MTDEHRTWFNYVPIADAGPDYKDDGTEVLLTIPLLASEGEQEMEVALIGTPQTIRLIRLSTPNSDGKLSPERIRRIENVTEHMIAVLRLTYDASLDRARNGEDFISIGNFSVEGKPSLSVKITHGLTQGFEVNIDLIKNFFGASRGLRRLLTLVTDAGHPMIPMPFRYLSLYKVLELELRDHGTWRGLTELLAAYEDEFKALAISNKKLVNFVHHFRDRCAHIKTGGADLIGLTGLEFGRRGNCANVHATLSKDRNRSLE